MSYYYRDEAHKDDAVSIPAIKEMLAELGTPTALVREVPATTAGTHITASSYWNPKWREVEATTWSFAEDILHLRARSTQ